MEALSTVFQPMKLRKTIKYRNLCCYIFSDTEIVISLCTFFNREEVSPQVRSRLVNSFAKRHRLYPDLIKNWLHTFENDVRPFVQRVDAPERVPISVLNHPKIVFVSPNQK